MVRPPPTHGRNGSTQTHDATHQFIHARHQGFQAQELFTELAGKNTRETDHEQQGHVIPLNGIGPQIAVGLSTQRREHQRHEQHTAHIPEIRAVAQRDKQEPVVQHNDQHTAPVEPLHRLQPHLMFEVGFLLPHHHGHLHGAFAVHLKIKCQVLFWLPFNRKYKIGAIQRPLPIQSPIPHVKFRKQIAAIHHINVNVIQRCVTDLDVALLGLGSWVIQLQLQPPTGIGIALVQHPLAIGLPRQCLLQNLFQREGR